MTRRLLLVASWVCLAVPAWAQSSKSEASKRPEPTKAQTEEWLKEHIEAWNEDDVAVTVRDCRIVVVDHVRKRSEIVDLRGLLLPVEVIRLGGKDATIRLRVKQKHSGTYSMYRKCDETNRYCEDATGKFQKMPWLDLTVTHVDDFRGSSEALDVTKTNRLEAAIEHYSRLCGAMEDARNRLF